MDVRLPDGTIVTNVPDNFSQSDLTAKLAANGYDISGSIKQPVGAQLTSKIKAPETPLAQYLKGPGMAGTLERLGSGMMKGMVIDPMKAVANIGAKGAHDLGLITDEQLKQFGEAERQLTKQYATEYEPAKSGELVGTALLPLGKGVGISGALKQGAIIGGMTEAASQQPDDTDFLGRVALGSSVGAISAPVLSGLTTATLRGLGRLVRSGYELSGKTAPEILSALSIPQKSKSVLKAVEGEPELYAAKLREAERHPVPGYQETSATKTAGLEKTVVAGAEDQLVGRAPTEYGQRTLHNVKALKDAIGSIAGTPKAYADAVAARAEAANPYLHEFRKQMFPSTPELEGFFNTPLGREAFTRAKELLANKRIPSYIGEITTKDPYSQMITSTTPRQYTGEFLEAVRQSMKGQIKSNVLKGIDEAERKAITGVKDAYTEYLENMAQDTFGKGMQAFRDFSRPINRMDVGRVLKGSMGASESKTAAQNFISSVLDSPTTIKKASGDPRFGRGDIKNILTEDEMKLVNGVFDKLRKEEVRKTLASFGAKAENIAAAPKTHWPSFLWAPVTLAHGLQKWYGDKISSKVANDLAVELLYPEKFASAIDKALTQTRQRKDIVSGVVKVVGRNVPKNYLEQQQKKEQEANKTLENLRLQYSVPSPDALRAIPVTARPSFSQQPEPLYDMAEQYGLETGE